MFKPKDVLMEITHTHTYTTVSPPKPDGNVLKNLFIYFFFEKRKETREKRLFCFLEPSSRASRHPRLHDYITRFISSD
jgi:hypothetical protein